MNKRGFQKLTKMMLVAGIFTACTGPVNGILFAHILEKGRL